MLQEKKSKRGAWIALGCVAALLVLVIVLENTMQPTSMLFTVLKKGAVYALVAASLNLLNGFTGPGAGGLHAAGRLHLRHSDHSLCRPGERLLPLRRLGGEFLPAGAVRRRRPGSDPGCAGGADPGGLCGGGDRLAYRPAGAAAEERLPGHRHPGLCGDHPGHLPVGPAGPRHQRRQRAEELSHLLQLQHRERQWGGGAAPFHLCALPAGGSVHRDHGVVDQLHLWPGLQGHPGG